MSDSLSSKNTDHLAASLKAVLGPVPFIGAAVSEVIGYVIPNQRMDRIADFCRRLESLVGEHQRALVQKRIVEPEGVDILEEALWQSARALSEERRERIAGLVKNGLTKEEMNLAETKKLLQLLSQLSDVELIKLRALACWEGEDISFKKKVQPMIEPVRAFVRSKHEVLDAAAVYDSIDQQLIRLDLIAPVFWIARSNGELPEFDRTTGKFKPQKYETTSLGNLLLKSADFYPDKSDKLPIVPAQPTWEPRSTE